MTTYRMYATASPPTTSAGDNNSISVGVEFYVTTDCTLDTIWWWQPTTGARTGSRSVALYRVSDQALIGGYTGANASGSGWQPLQRPTTTILTANTRYRAVVLHPNGGYPATNGYFAGATDETNGALVIPVRSNVTDGAQGGYQYGAANNYTFTNLNATNFWVDVEVTPIPASRTFALSGGGIGVDLAKKTAKAIFTTVRNTAAQLGPWVAAVAAHPAGDVWNHATPTQYGGVRATGARLRGSSVAITGGGTPTATGIKKAQGATTITGGGALSDVGIKRAGGSISITGGGALSDIALKNARGAIGSTTGGGNPTITGVGHTPGHGGFALSGGDVDAETGIKHAIATMAAEATYGGSTYGGSTYGTLPYITGGGSPAVTTNARRSSSIAITGGGALTASGTRAAHATGTLSGGGGGSLTNTAARFQTAQLTGGGNGSIVARKAATTTVAIHGGGNLAVTVLAIRQVDVDVEGGGAVTAAGVKHGIASEAATTYGIAEYGTAEYGTAATVVGISLHGGGAVLAAGGRLARAQFAESDGGTLTALGLKGAFVTVVIHGGGRLYGPIPIVLQPGLRIISGQGNITLLTAEGEVSIQNGQGNIELLTQSVRVPYAVP